MITQGEPTSTVDHSKFSLKNFRRRMSNPKIHKNVVSQKFGAIRYIYNFKVFQALRLVLMHNTSTLQMNITYGNVVHKAVKNVTILFCEAKNCI